MNSSNSQNILSEQKKEQPQGYKNEWCLSSNSYSARNMLETHNPTKVNSEKKQAINSSFNCESNIKNTLPQIEPLEKTFEQQPCTKTQSFETAEIAEEQNSTKHDVLTFYEEFLSGDNSVNIETDIDCDSNNFNESVAVDSQEEPAFETQSHEHIVETNLFNYDENLDIADKSSCKVDLLDSLEPPESTQLNIALCDNLMQPTISIEGDKVEQLENTLNEKLLQSDDFGQENFNSTTCPCTEDIAKKQAIAENIAITIENETEIISFTGNDNCNQSTRDTQQQMLGEVEENISTYTFETLNLQETDEEKSEQIMYEQDNENNIDVDNISGYEEKIVHI